ncbi:MAG: radical SAM protein [Pseudomonadota bacterium]
MRKKILLINPRKGWRPALGLLYVASYLRRAQHEVKIIEFIDEDFNTRKNKKLWEELYIFDPDFIGLGVISWNRKVASRIIKKVRETTKDKIIICGGKDPSFSPEKYLSYSADVVVIGEGEETAVELINAYDSSKTLEDIKGIAFLKERKVFQTSRREPKDLYNLLYPAVDLVDYVHYTNIKLGGIPGHFIKTGFLMANRGCPFRCKFCTEPIRNVYRERPIGEIIDEIKWQIDRYKIKGLVLLDDLFYFTDRRVTEFCEGLLKEKIKLKIYAQTRVDKVGSKETLKLMKEAGFMQLALGVESGSPRMLIDMNKGITIEQVKTAIKAINDAGIYTYIFLIIGLPGETKRDMDQTVELLKEVKPTFVTVNYYMPMPGTSYYNEQDGEMLDDLSFSLTENPNFRSTLSRNELLYYRSKFLSLGQKNANLNLFTYPRFSLFLLEMLVFRPYVLLRQLYTQKTKKSYTNYFEALKVAMINHRICG